MLGGSGIRSAVACLELTGNQPAGNPCHIYQALTGHATACCRRQLSQGDQHVVSQGLRSVRAYLVQVTADRLDPCIAEFLGHVSSDRIVRAHAFGDQAATQIAVKSAWCSSSSTSSPI